MPCWCEAAFALGNDYNLDLLLLNKWMHTSPPVNRVVWLCGVQQRSWYSILTHCWLSTRIWMEELRYAESLQRHMRRKPSPGSVILHNQLVYYDSFKLLSFILFILIPVLLSPQCETIQEKTTLKSIHHQWLGESMCKVNCAESLSDYGSREVDHLLIKWLCFWWVT